VIDLQEDPEEKLDNRPVNREQELFSIAIQRAQP